MTDETYNGWTNWATWNLALWVDNDEYSYHRRIEMGEQLRGQGWDAESVKSFCWDLFPNGTPDMEECDLDEVNYQEMAQAWNDEMDACS